MKVKIPREIKIAARDFTVGFNENLLRDEGNRGVTWWQKQEIKLASNLHPQQLDVTFLHEYVHIIDEYWGRLGLNEETTISLAEGLYQLLKDNLGIEFDWGNISEIQ